MNMKCPNQKISISEAQLTSAEVMVKLGIALPYLCKTSINSMLTVGFKNPSEFSYNAEFIYERNIN